MNPLGHLGIYFSIPLRILTVCYKNWILYSSVNAQEKNLITLQIFPVL